MDERDLLQLLQSVRNGTLSAANAVERLKHLPFEDLGFAKVDHHRALRQGYAEVIFGKGKTPQHVAEIVRAMLQHKAARQNILVTRAGPAARR
jgi:pyridinium-3,5-biscarboxylic acid mononucleotide synthase